MIQKAENIKALLDIKNLKVHYKVYDGVSQVLDGVNLHVYTGEKIRLYKSTGQSNTSF